MMSDEWKTLRLRDVAVDRGLIGGPFGSSLGTGDYVPSGVPVIRGANLSAESKFNDQGFVFVSPEKAQRDLARNLAEPGDVIFTQRGTLGQVGVVPSGPYSQYVISQSQMRLRVDRDLALPDYIYCYFRTPTALAAIAARTIATGVPHINLGILGELQIPLPPLPDQRHIVTVIEQADALRARRREAIGRLDELAQSIFIDMFGDTADDGHSWPISTIGEIADVQGGLQVTAARKSYPVEIPYLRVANVYRDRLDLSEVKIIRASEAEIRRTMLAAGDLLVVEGHGNPEEIGRVAAWDGSIASCTHQNHLIRVRLDRDRALPVYVSRYLNSHKGRRHLLASARTTSGLNTISTSIVRSTPLPVPPLAVQREFSDRIDSIRSHAARANRHLVQLDVLFASLQYRAFRGEL